MNSKKFTIVSSYENKEDFGGDPCGYYVEQDGKILMTYGDEYHNKGQDKCMGFIDGCIHSKVKIDAAEIAYEDRADYNSVYE